jgi:hypothetical protein
MADIADLTGQCGVRTIPGYKTNIYAVCGCDILTFPALKTTTGVGDSITLDGDIVLKTGKKFAQLEVISESGKVTETEVGMVGSQVFQSQFEFKLPKTIASDEWLDANPNACMVFIIEDKDGNKRVLGNDKVATTRTAAVGTNGPALTDEKSWAITIQDNTGRIAPYYEGVIDQTGA